MDEFLWATDNSGAFDWVRTASAPSYQYGRGVTLLPGGDSVMAGYGYEPMALGRGEPNETSVPAGTWLAARTRAGALRWAKAVTGVGNAWDLHADSQGRLTLGGSFGGTVTVGENESKSFGLDCPLPSYNCGVVVRWVP